MSGCALSIDMTVYTYYAIDTHCGVGAMADECESTTPVLCGTIL
jgi:hypothetical protein